MGTIVPKTKTWAPQVLRCAASDVRWGDQVAFVPAGHGDHVAGGITGMRASTDGSTITLVVDGHVHCVSSGASVVVIRLPTATSRRLPASAPRR